MRKADWERMRSLLEETDWDCMGMMDPDAALQHLLKRIVDAAQFCIPYKIIQERNFTHPWLW